MYKSKYKFFLIPLFIFFVIFSLKLSVSAEGSIYFPMQQNQNNIFNDRDKTQIDYYLNANNYYYFCWVKSISSGQHQYNYVKWPKSSTSSGIIATTSGYQFVLSYYGSGPFTCGYIDVKQQNNYHGYYENYVGNNPTSYIQGNKTSSVYSSTVSYLSNISIYDSTNVDSRHVVLIYGTYIQVPTEGHSQGYMNNIPQFGYPIGMHPTSAPTVPTYTQPSLSNPPTIDTTDVKSVLESIFDLISWVLVAILSYLGSIIQTLIDWFTFISNLSIWIADFIKQCFVALMDFLYNNFTHLFAPLFNFLTGIFNFLFNENDQMSVYDLIKSFKSTVSTWLSNYWSNSFLSDFWTNLSNTYTYFQTLFAKLLLFFDKLILFGTVNGEFTISNLINALFVPSTSDVVTALHNHDTFGFHDCGHAINEKANYLVTTFSSLTPAKTFYIPSTSWHGETLGGFYVDFSWYDDFKLYGDTIITIFLTISFVYWLILNFGGWLRGSSVGTDLSRLGNDK